jgi:hypothetical protein
MDVAAIITAVSTVIDTAVKLGPTVIQTVEDAAPFAEAIVNSISGKKVVTQADLDAMTAQITALSAELQAPLPPAQAGDPDFTA